MSLGLEGLMKVKIEKFEVLQPHTNLSHLALVSNHRNQH